MKANLLSQGTYFPSSLCPTTPRKKLRFQTTKTSKIVHKHFMCSFKRRSFSGFGAFCKNHFWGSTGHGHVQALGALTQASTVIVAPPKEDLLEFFHWICRLVEKRSKTEAEKNGTKDSSRKSRVPTSALVLEAGKV